MGSSNSILNYFQQRAMEKRMPFSVNFELLPVCNLNCKMCYIRSSWNDVNRLGGLKTVDEWLELAKQMKEAGSLMLLLSGGEVFLYPDFKRLYIELYKMGFSIKINTNGTMIDEEVVEWLKFYPPRCVSISLYGASNETYEALCGAKSMFDKVEKAIDLLQENNIILECKTMLNPLNYKDLENIWDFVRKKGIPYEAAVYSFPATRKECEEMQVRFSAQEVADAIFYRNRIMADDDGYKAEIIKYFKKYERTKDIPGKINYGFNCSACNTSAWINWKGQMIPCALMVEPYTYPFEIGFLNAWEELKQKTDQIMLSTECSHCEKRQVCTVCPASSYAETGSFSGTSKYHCEMTDELLKEIKRFIREEKINLSEYDDNGDRR